MNVHPPHFTHPPTRAGGELVALLHGWRFARDGRTYYITGAPPCGHYVYYIAARIDDRDIAAWVDLMRPAEVACFGRVVAGDDEALAGAVSDDLADAYVAVMLARVRAEIDGYGAAPRRGIDVIVRGVDDQAARAIVRIAGAAGATAEVLT